MIKTYSFDVDFIGAEKSFSLTYKVAASSLSLAYARLRKQVVDNWATRVVSAHVRLVYRINVDGMCSFRSLPFKYSSVILDCEDSDG